VERVKGGRAKAERREHEVDWTGWTLVNMILRGGKKLYSTVMNEHEVQPILPVGLSGLIDFEA